MKIPSQFQSFGAKVWLLFFTFSTSITNAYMRNSKSYIGPIAYWMTSITNSPLHSHTHIQRLNFKNSWWDKLSKIISCSKGEWNYIVSGLFIFSSWIALIVVGLVEKPNKFEGIYFFFWKLSGFWFSYV